MIFQRLLAEAGTYYLNRMKKGTSIWSATYGGWRMERGQKRKRPIESVVLENGILDDLMADVSKFLSSSKWCVHTFTIVVFEYRSGYHSNNVCK